MLTQPPTLTVSQLNRQVRHFLEDGIGLVHVEGELSNLSKPASGHLYFTLKDNTAQIRCVFFKNRHGGPVPAKLTDGQQIVASGSLSLYEARGDYQLIVEQVTQAGAGALFQRFEALKIKLSAEGLFHPERKKSLPLMPRSIGIISSPSGAALQDILSTLARRFPLAQVVIYSSEVQGLGAPQQLIKALLRAQSDNRCDVLILARGGGSIEDLWAFNDESLARHIAACVIPIVSGVGHETDFTIADFVADLRAETPTAAATAVTPNCVDLFYLINQAELRLITAMTHLLRQAQNKLHYLLDKIASPKKTISSYWQNIDYLERQLQSHWVRLLQQKSHQLHLCNAQLHRYNPIAQIAQTQVKLDQIKGQLYQHMQSKMQHLTFQMHSNLSTLHAVSPLATLDRGYAIATHKNKVLFSSEQVLAGDAIKVRLATGSLECKVIKTTNICYSKINTHSGT